MFDQLFEFEGTKSMFVSTKPGTREDYKAQFKNHNLPILQHMYMGSRTTPLKCMITGTEGFQEFPCIVQKRPMMRFRIEFNHIRQRAAQGRQAGTSIDKNPNYGPSELFRSRGLDERRYRKDLIEFMCMMPVDADAHKWITQSSAYGDITLVNFATQHWPWHLQNEQNFLEICDHFQLDGLKYDQFVDHLSNIHHAPIHQRLSIRG